MNAKKRSNQPLRSGEGCQKATGGHQKVASGVQRTRINRKARAGQFQISGRIIPVEILNARMPALLIQGLACSRPMEDRRAVQSLAEVSVADLGTDLDRVLWRRSSV